MIATQDQTRCIKPFAGAYFQHSFAKVLGLHSGVSAVLIHLVRSSFDQEARTVLKSLIDGRLKHPGMRRAHGIHPEWTPFTS